MDTGLPGPPNPQARASPTRAAAALASLLALLRSAPPAIQAALAAKKATPGADTPGAAGLQPLENADMHSVAPTSCSVTGRAEFAVRRVTHMHMIRTGRRAQACGAARTAARLYRAGMSGAAAVSVATRTADGGTGGAA